MESNFRKRDPAYAVEVKELLAGNYFKTEGWNPNYLETSFGLNISRVSLFGTVIEVDNKSISLDDGSGVIEVRSFDEFDDFNNIDTGDFVFLIGKVRQFNDSIYISPESCKKVDKDWKKYSEFNVSKVKELFKSENIKNPKIEVEFSSGVEAVEEKVDEAVEATESSKSIVDEVLKFIDDNDSGAGVEKVRILDSFDDSNIGEVVDNLIMEGDIFEIKPGVFKVLK